MKVYLYELDSVRNSAAEIQDAQNRLFEETIVNRNTVVLSPNQLLDGMGVTGVLCGKDGEKNYRALLQLFQLGLLKVCKFTDPATGKTVESLGEYWIQNKMRKQFVHSGIDLEQDDEVREKVEKALSSGNLLLVKRWAGGKSGKEKEKAEYVYYIAKLTYKLGEYDIWVEEETGEKRVKFAELLEYILNIAPDAPLLKDYPDVQKALDVLRTASLKITDRSQRQYRSIWYRTLKVAGNGVTNVPVVINIARYIIDLCYNISVESGISGVHLPYMVDEHQKARKYSDKDTIKKWQCDYIIKKLREHLELSMSTLWFPPWEIAVAQMEEIGVEIRDDGKRGTWSLNNTVAVRFIQYVLVSVAWVGLSVILGAVVFPHIDALLTPIISDTFCIKVIYTFLSVIFSAWVTNKLEKLVLRAISYIWPDVYIKEFGAQILDEIFKLLYRQMRINGYLKRAGLHPQRKRNRTKKP